MDTLQDAYKENEEEIPTTPSSSAAATTPNHSPTDPAPPPPTTEDGIKPEANEDETSFENLTNKPSSNSSQDDEEEEEGEEVEGEVEEEELVDQPSKKQKTLSSLIPQQPQQQQIIQIDKMPTQKTPITATKKAKKKNNNVWTKPTSRKGKKKGKTNNNSNAANEDTVMITPVPRFPDKSDDTPGMSICLSKVFKAEKVDISEDRLTAGSTKGYRMVRATRGVAEGAWYFEIKVVNLGETGHTRLGWSTEKGDLQAPVGYDLNSFGYRDIDGSKVHRALREKYGEQGYKEGDVIGFYINLPDGESYAPKPPNLVLYKGQRFLRGPDVKEDPPKVVPGSEISFFKNGVCQGIAFKDLNGGRYYPAASMYTLPNQPNCVVKFNFGPDFESFPDDFEGRLAPRPMIEVPYHSYENRVENGVPKEKTH